MTTGINLLNGAEFYVAGESHGRIRETAPTYGSLDEFFSASDL